MSKTESVKRLLTDNTDWSDGLIAQSAGCSRQFVQRLRALMNGGTSLLRTSVERRQSVNGRKMTLPNARDLRAIEQMDVLLEKFFTGLTKIGDQHLVAIRDNPGQGDPKRFRELMQERKQRIKERLERFEKRTIAAYNRN